MKVSSSKEAGMATIRNPSISWRSIRRIAPGAMLPLVFILVGIAFWAQGCAGCYCRDTETCSLGVPEPVVDGHEPPVNFFLADSPWPMSHRNPYCQASSPYPGPAEPVPAVVPDFIFGSPVLITVAFSSPYPDGSRVIWGSTTLDVFKANPCQGACYYQRIEKENIDFSNLAGAISGAYTLVDNEGTFFVPRLTRINAYGDVTAGDALSSIEKKGFFEIPPEHLHGEDDDIVGLNMTYDGMLAFATRRGTCGVVSRTFDEAHYLYLGEEDEISNSIACDENGGIYVVTSRQMIRVQWTGSSLTTDEAEGGWTAEYEAGEGVGGIRLGPGSGATPSLMGVGDEDRFVVITDGQELMHLVLFWRDAIPADWVQIPGTKDRRIAAQIPVTFGDPGAAQSLSEQSVCVRGYGALVVNNLLQQPVDNIVLAIIYSGLPEYAPYGAEKFEWDPVTRQLQSAWVNPDISLPNGIPTMSAATGLIYDVGQRDGVWTMEALSWDTGESVFFNELDSDWKFNSAYAATEVGLGSGLYTGTLFGMTRLHP